MHKYFSIKNGGHSHQKTDDFSHRFWRGFKNYVDRKIDDGSFGIHFPLFCEDHPQAIIGTDKVKFFECLDLELPYAYGYYNFEDEERDWWCEVMPIADTIEFCFKYIAKPIQGKYHDYQGHYHLDFDESAGKIEYRDFILHIFQTHGLSYTLTEEGSVERAGDPLLSPLHSSLYQTNDNEFNTLINEAYRRFRSPDITERKIALEKAVDALERIEGLNGRPALSDFIDPNYRENFKIVLKNDVDKLFHAANKIQIRHYKPDTEPITENANIDYLFYRVINYIKLYYSYKPF